jgi:hypothetical protein
MKYALVVRKNPGDWRLESIIVLPPNSRRGHEVRARRELSVLELDLIMAANFDSRIIFRVFTKCFIVN